MQRKRTPKLSLDEVQLRLLRLMRDATSAGIIAWEVSETDSNWYYTKSGPVDSYIHFKWPSYNGEVGSDRDSVDVGGAGRFMIGTPGWQLALDILAAGDETWRDHVVRVREGYQRQIDRLELALRKRRRRPGRRRK
ncbi:MAG TPA: hypothetical protein VF796_06910 [Humisphaera sp.]